MSVATHEVAREKREFAPTEERTEAGRSFRPYTDIHETEQAVVVSMEMPGVDKSSIDIRLDRGVLTVKGSVDAARFESLRPIHSEFNVGNYVRAFTVSTKIDSTRISASVADGVLTLELPKTAESVAKRIAVN